MTNFLQQGYFLLQQGATPCEIMGDNYIKITTAP